MVLLSQTGSCGDLKRNPVMMVGIPSTLLLLLYSPSPPFFSSPLWLSGVHTGSHTGVQSLSPLPLFLVCAGLRHFFTKRRANDGESKENKK